MAIAKMNRFTLLTFRDNRNALLKDLQKFGDVHFRDLSRDELEDMEALKQEHSVADITRCESELDRVQFTLAKLAPHAPKAGLTAKRPTLSYDEFDAYLNNYDYRSVCDYVKEQDDKAAAIKSEISRLTSENEGLKAWLSLDTSPEQLDALSVAKYLVGTVNKTTADLFRESLEKEFDALYIEFLGTVKDDMAMVLLTDPDSYEDLFARAKDLGFSKSNLSFRDVPSKIVKENNDRIKALAAEQEQAQDSIKSKAGEHSSLLIAADCLKTTLAREKAAENFLGSDSVVFIEGWVPQEDDSEFRAIIARDCGDNYFLEQEAVEDDSASVPIKLKNNKIVSAFESVTAMYSMPRYNEFDPTPLMAPFYWFFFGLMVGDMGFGLVLLVGTTLALKLLDLKPGTRKFLQFFFYLSFGVILGGAVYGSLFGVGVFKPITVMENGVPLLDEAGKVVKKAILDTDYDIVNMILFSIGLGVVHVTFGLIVKAAKCIKQGDPAGAIFDSLFWILAVFSGIGLVVAFMAPGMLPAALSSVCGWVFGLSMLGIVLTAGRTSPSIGGKIGNGLYGAYGITSYVGDLVSYTRIVALALSGAYIGFSFNLMAGQIPGFMKFILGAVIAVFGQALNLGLSLLGAYVHTCRLQYVEYFGKFYDGGGVPFAPLTLKNESVHIKK
ncbi:V-type ATP synthase subunit I [Ruminococcaceae bacterium OttesenSCG-928-L11]|nr:V-type ATP synthase subunit I [Ruminococcaceae bacterium OttesenSCG-928-L11]